LIIGLIKLCPFFAHLAALQPVAPRTEKSVVVFIAHEFRFVYPLRLLLFSFTSQGYVTIDLGLLQLFQIFARHVAVIGTEPFRQTPHGGLDLFKSFTQLPSIVTGRPHMSA
jgi:hypothetical protein